MKLIADNSQWCRKATVTLSTVKLPFIDRVIYESCLFLSDGDSEVLDTYDTINDAVIGHNILAGAYGLK